MSIINMRDLEYLLPDTIDGWNAYACIWYFQNGHFHPNACVINYGLECVRRIAPRDDELICSCIVSIVNYIQRKPAHPDIDHFVDAVDILKNHTDSFDFHLYDELEVSSFIAIRALFGLCVDRGLGLRDFAATLNRFYRRIGKVSVISDLDQAFAHWTIANKHLVQCPTFCEPDRTFKRLLKAAQRLLGRVP